MIKELLGILGILILLFEIYQCLIRFWLRRLLEKRKERKANAQIGRSATEERAGLSVLPREQGEKNYSEARNAGILAIAQGVGWAKEEDSDGRILRPKPKLRILRDYRRGNPCIRGVWSAWNK